MKTNGLRNKKPQCARAAWRIAKRAPATTVEVMGTWVPYRFARMMRWHRATWRK